MRGAFLTVMDIEKLKKDRKILKGIDSKIAQKSSWGALGYLLSYGIFLALSDILIRYPRFAITLGILLIVMTVCRIYMVLRFEQQYGHGPMRWRRIFLFVNFFHTILFSFFIFVAILEFGQQQVSWLVMAVCLILSGLLVEVWLPYRRINEVNLSLLLVPLFLSFLFLNSWHGYIAGLTLFVAYILLIQHARVMCNRFWDSLFKDFLCMEKSRDLEVLQAKIEKMSDLRTDFLTDLTHEIRTPINSVLGMITLLSETELDDNQKEIVTLAQHSSDAMLNLIGDILDFSKIAAGTIVLDSTVFNLKKCIDEALELLGPQAHEKGIELSCLYDPDLPIRVRGDAHKISQVINNLVGNAIKFSEEGEIIVTVHMTCLSAREGLLRVHVIDQGHGISREKQDMLFRAFHKADVSTSRRSGGTGLGLAISKGLVEAMNGQIGLISELGKGSTFWFTVHLRLSTQQVQTSLGIKEFQGLKVLLVGMTKGLEQSLFSEFESWNFEVESINEGYDKALQLMRARARQECGYDLIVLNLGHGYTGNLKLSKIILQDPIFKNVKQILLTTLEQKSLSVIKQTLEKNENMSIVTKPVKSSHLYEILSILYGVSEGRKASVWVGKKSINDEKQYKILVVEDNKVNQMVTTGMLKRLGYAVKVLCNGKEALGILEDKVFDLVLMGCQIPEIDGYTVTKHLRKKEELENKKHMPVIAMTTNGVDCEEARCLAAGMDDVLIKPVSIEELDSKLRAWLGSDHAADVLLIQ